MTTYNRVPVKGLETFYREAGPKDAPTIVLLHGFPSSSHMFRDLIPRLADRFHVIAPDYIGFGFSAQPDPKHFRYTFDNLTAHIEELLFGVLKLERFSISVQDYGAPVGFRIAAGHPDAIPGIIIQNGNAYVEGISPAFEPLKAFWANRNAETEEPVRALLTAATTKFQYTHGAGNPSKISPDSYTFDQWFLDRLGNDSIQLDLFHDYPSNVALYDKWHDYFRTKQPPTLIVWGQNDPFFTVEGAKAFLRDLPTAELHLLNAGHFALEEEADFIGQRIREFADRNVIKTGGQERKTMNPSLDRTL
jgi:pimeloyl-ACP methyl ester carboxylesterase